MNGQYNAGDTVLGNWKLSRLIGEGSFGRVFEAVREDFGTTYKAAIKIITIPQRQSEIKSARAEGMDEKSVNAYFRSFVEEIVREFALMSRLKGTANVVSYEDHTVIPHQGTIGWDIIIRMELLTPLLDHTSTKTFTRQDVIKLGIDICRALELCQKFNIIHRDIKPENIFISDLGDYKLGDFGIARTIEKTTSGLSKKGTYTYMAPEVYREGAYGSSVDIYSLGIVLYRLLNDNRAPFLPEYPAPITHSDREASLAKRISGAKLPEPKNADGRLAEIVLKACAYDSKDRYSSPMQMREELEAILYSREEAPIIYPNGDEAPIKSLDYVSTDAKHPEPIADEATESVFGSAAASEVTESVFGEPSAEDKTESIFESIAVESQELAPASRTSDISSETGTAESSKSKKSQWIVPVAIIAAIIGIFLFSDTLLNANKSDLPDDIITSPVSETSDVEYDANGNIIKEPYYNADGSIDHWLEYEYDTNGNRIKQTYYTADGAIGHWYEYEYDAKGNRIKETQFAADGSINYWYEYEHDTNGNEIKSTKYAADGSIEYEHEYDTNGNETQTADADGSIKSADKSENDMKGNETTSTFDGSYEYVYDSNGKLIYDLEYVDGTVVYKSEFDSNGNRIKRTGYNKDGSIMYWEEYDYNKETICETIYDCNGTILEVHEFDFNGKPIRITRYNADGSVKE